MSFLLIIKELINLLTSTGSGIVSNCVFFNVMGFGFIVFFDNLASVVAVETEKAVC